VLKLIEAPRAHEMVRRYLHDCEYGGVAAIRQGMREMAKLKARKVMSGNRPSCYRIIHHKTIHHNAIPHNGIPHEAIPSGAKASHR
jgi:hypothetical protein